MFRFEHPEYLYFLFLVPLLGLFFLMAWYQRKKALKRLAEVDLLPQLAPGLSGRPHRVKFALLAVALALLIIGWANPQWSTQRREVERQGVDLIIALDISRSMLAEDIQPNRLERAKRFATQLVDELAGNNIGVELFACTPFMQVPLTTDYAFANQALRAASTDQAPAQGSAIGDAIDLAESAFEEASLSHRALIILSDGEEHDGTAVAAAEAAASEGLIIYTIGIGTQEGGFMPVLNSRRRTEYIENDYGEPVRTQLQPEALSDIAAAAGGIYYNLETAGEASVADQLQKQLSGIEQRAFEAQAFTDFESYFQYFLGLALLLLVVEFGLSFRRSSAESDFDWYR